MTPASFLREAADRLEELAEKATPGPWRVECSDSCANEVWGADYPEGEMASDNAQAVAVTWADLRIIDGPSDNHDREDSNAALIARFGNPQVARAVFHGLRAAATSHELGVKPWVRDWLAVAAAVLGRPAPDQGGSE